MITAIREQTFPVFSAEKLTAVLSEQGRQLNWFAARVGYSQTMVSKVLNGHFPMSERFAVRAAHVLDIRVEELLAEPEAAA